MVQTFVIDKTSKKVKRHGFMDFENDGQFSSSTEEIVQSDQVLKPGLEFQDWYWNNITEEFQQIPP